MSMTISMFAGVLLIFAFSGLFYAMGIMMGFSRRMYKYVVVEKRDLLSTSLRLGFAGLFTGLFMNLFLLLVKEQPFELLNSIANIASWMGVTSLLFVIMLGPVLFGREMNKFRDKFNKRK